MRGERVNDAIEIVMRYIDDAIMLGVPSVRILHGKGTGALREEIQKYVRSHLELDIVSEAADGVHFVEVKARTAPVTTTVLDQVNAVKQKRISAAAGQYLNKKHMEGKEVFFDIVSVLFDGEQTVVRYFPQAWIPMFV